MNKKLAKAGCYVAMIWCTGAMWCSAQTVSGAYKVGIGYCGIDGDLHLSLTLGICELENATYLRIALEHEMSDLGYGKAMSRFALRPFETALCKNGESGYVWKAPGGERVSFVVTEAAPTSAHENPGASPMNIDGIDVNAVREGRNGRYYMRELERGKLCYITENQIIWRYADGTLDEIRLASGKLFSVKAKGGRVREIALGGDVICSVEWGRDGVPLNVKWAKREITFAYDDRRRMVTMSGSEEAFAGDIEYNDIDLVRRVRFGGKTSPLFAWSASDQSIGNSTFLAKPFALQKAGDVNYRVHFEGDTVILEENVPHMERRVLRVNFNGGLIRWIDETN